MPHTVPKIKLSSSITETEVELSHEHAHFYRLPDRRQLADYTVNPGNDDNNTCEPRAESSRQEFGLQGCISIHRFFDITLFAESNLGDNTVERNNPKIAKQSLL